MSRMFAIGDIHGCLSLLDKLIDSIKPRAEDTLIFLGDMVDRGPNSKGVIDRLRLLESECQLITILGNHEEMMLGCINEPEFTAYWLRYGGDEALASFELPANQESLRQIPTVYIDWLKNLRPYYETQDFIFCHSAPKPNMPIDEQCEDLRWRKLNKQDVGHMSGKTVVCGHSEQRSGIVWRQDGLICIDTYAYGGGKLTALEIISPTQLMVWQVDDTHPQATICPLPSLNL